MVAGSPRSYANELAVSVILSDLDLALTFLEVARVSTDPATRRRNRENARKVYETVLHFRPRLVTTGEEKRGIEQKLGMLKNALEHAGELPE